MNNRYSKRVPTTYAKIDGSCPNCRHGILSGECIERRGDAWGHVDCAASVRDRPFIRVNDNGAGATFTAKTPAIAEAIACELARTSGYASVSFGARGEVQHVDRYRCDRSGDRHVYTSRYNRESCADEQVVVLAASEII